MNHGRKSSSHIATSNDDASRLGRRSFLGAIGIALLAEACGGSIGDEGAGGAPPDGGGGPGLDPAKGSAPGAVDGGAGIDASAPPFDGGTTKPDGDGATKPDDAGATKPDDAGQPDAGAQSDGGTVADPATIPESSAFPLGIASGDPTNTAALLWARYSGSNELELRVWEMDGDTYKRQIFASKVTPADGGFVHEDVTGLTGGARYRYAFFELQGATATARSAIGRFRAAPAPSSLANVTLGAVSCTLNLLPKTTIERAGARDDLDAFLLLGDTTYNDGASTRSQYRDRWAMNLGTNGYKALRASTSVVATWDDHEVENDWNPETISATKLATAFAAFFEHLPVRRASTASNRIWRKRSWGKTLDVFILDCRSERLPSTRNTPGAQYISRAQMDWLKSGLLASTATFKVIVNSVPITDFPASVTAEVDRWEGYPAQRTEILEHIDTNAIPGVLWIAGDFHVASMGRVAMSGPGQSAIEVLVGPGAQIGGSAAGMVAPQFDWATSTNNYATFEFDPTARTVKVQFHGSSGNVLQEKTFTL